METSELFIVYETDCKEIHMSRVSIRQVVSILALVVGFGSMTGCAEREDPNSLSKNGVVDEIEASVDYYVQTQTEESQDTANVETIPWKGTPRPEIAQLLREHPGGVQINEDQIAWNDGNVVLSIPSSPPPQSQDESSSVDADISINAASDCPAGWFCLWQDINFTNRRLQFRDANCQNLTNFGFNDLASSWFNRNGGAYRVYRNIGCAGLLFTAPSGAQSSNVGPVNNDQASSICRGLCP
jgi:hypothetical protein